MKLIPLNAVNKNKYKGLYFAQVDDSDYEWLSKWNWQIFKVSHIVYACRKEKIDNKTVCIFMHREILGLKKFDKLCADHKDRCGLNNQRYNLRTATYHQNSMNRTKVANRSSKFIGVSVKNKKFYYTKLSGEKCTYHGTYISACIEKNGNATHLGNFKTEEEAAMAYDKAAIELFGEFANTNFKNEPHLNK